MHIKRNFPHPVREIEHLMIPLADGTRLAARIWLPEDAEHAPVPAILEYLPYRKLDGTAVRDALTHPYLAGHGYACVRVDIRGNGESDGLMLDEYLPQEQDDALEIIDWICQQPWCNGNLGMMGISWGGFNSLQVAARKPKALKAIITLCSTDDRYADDIHYKGGNLLLENQAWAATMLNFSAAAPDPRLVGENWQPLWQQRLENMPLLAANWLEHPLRDSFWAHGSVCENYQDIEAAVYCISGWGDSYINSIPRFMEYLPGPKKALIGPWIHKYPHFAIPDPAIGFLQEALRWWDYWLKGMDTGIMDEPVCTFYLQDSLPPAPMYKERPGAWVQTEGWPSRYIAEQCFSLTDNGLKIGEEPLQSALSVCSPLTTGTHHGEYCGFWYGPDFATDQRRDDAHSLCFTSEPLQTSINILGRPRLRLRGHVDQNCGQITVRLNDVAPNGQVAMICYGTLNLALRNSPATLEPPVPGEPMDIEVELNLIGHRLPAGHRLRISIATASFPLVWTSPKLTTFTLESSCQQLLLPTFAGNTITNPFQPPEAAEPVALEQLRPTSPSRTIVEDVATGEICVRVHDDLGCHQFLNHGLRVEQEVVEEYRSRPWDPNATRADIKWFYCAGRNNWEVKVESELHMSCDAQYFYLDAKQTAWLNGEQQHQKNWQQKVPRLAQ
ncbi:CocE/NonD family hydrolase [Zobellella iuensis]|uniref:CocE/NonD family hydrolase n=1 Tax=Zobellella iuensis TaxID=2803811 RepID=A0ABS1QNR5_9GAMM|nr:CocE/NonD family hydrolase [Zobellella iuensis]MBL1376485.1 CocE/NonD family hydrolase [Zobellella iuensis]